MYVHPAHRQPQKLGDVKQSPDEALVVTLQVVSEPPTLDGDETESSGRQR